MGIFAGILLTLTALICVALTVIGLPGTWILLAGAVALEIWREGTFGVWTFVIAIALAVIGELVEFAAGTVGASSQGASKRAGLGALVGGVIGAIAGTVLIPIPVVGTIVGSALGAGLCASGVEMALRQKTTGHIARIGAGAFVGRLLATVFKGAIALVMAIQLAIAAFA